VCRSGLEPPELEGEPQGRSFGPYQPDGNLHVVPSAWLPPGSPQAAAAGRLRRYKSSLTWNNGVYQVELGHDWIYAESEEQARQLANEQATKDFPLVESMFDDPRVPPYITDPSGTLALWKITEGTLGPEEKVAQSKGTLGPPSASATSRRWPSTCHWRRRSVNLPAQGLVDGVPFNAEPFAHHWLAKTLASDRDDRRG
jgi:hypothetical protein